MDNTSILSGESENVYDEIITSDAEYLSCESEETEEAKENDCLVTWKMLRKIRTKTDELRELIIEAERRLTGPHLKLGDLIDHNELKDVGKHLTSMSRIVEASNEILTKKVLEKNIADLTDRLKISKEGTFGHCNALALDMLKSKYENFKQKTNRAMSAVGTQKEADSRPNEKTEGQIDPTSSRVSKDQNVESKEEQKHKKNIVFYSREQKIFIGKVHYSLTEEMVKQHFGKYGLTFI